MRKRVCDVAGCIGKNTKVYLNGEKLPIKGFSDYVNLYLAGKDASQRCYEKVNDRWEICIAVSEGQFQQARPAASVSPAPHPRAGELCEQHQHGQGRHSREHGCRQRGRVRSPAALLRRSRRRISRPRRAPPLIAAS